ncbi:MAG TPA: FeoB-associated Cys-rich membrane protein [Chryseosolibacter sp.]|nr:FeoB-associated Cys-rich membrane protein [Chryseosolibacter sp.]
MFQQIVVLLAFAASVFYLARIAYKAFRTKQGCDTGCGKCGAVDLEAIAQKIREKGL